MMTKTMNKTNLQQIMKAITPSSTVTYRKGLAEVLDVFACIVKVHVLLTIATIDFYKTLRIVLSIRYTNKWDYNYSLNGICMWCCEHHMQTNPPLVNAVGAGMDFTMPSHPFIALVGFHRGVSHCRAGLPAENASQTSEEHMLKTIRTPEITHSSVANVLAEFRQEWELAAEEQDLIAIQGSIGLLLIDLVIGLGFRPSEQIHVLGSKLYAELQSILVVIPENGKGH
jgi:hypothetical protein